ncbi:MAG: GNAT family N-acetyltransferase [Oscillospiraceae bacterium]|nr:GNAT family N-acetyltransferase [Oscillospiraceae bacterium]
MTNAWISVFKEVFSDSTDNFLKVFSDRIVTKGKVVYSFCEEKVAAAGFIFPISAEINNKTYKGLYLYGLCTLPQFRKQGRMSRVLKEIDEIAEKEDYDFTFLATNSCEAIRLYSKNGYKKLNIIPKNRAFFKNGAAFEWCSKEEYLKNTSPKLYPCYEMRSAVLTSLEEFFLPAKCDGGYILIGKDSNEIIDYFPADVSINNEDGRVLNPEFLEDNYQYFIKKLNKDMPYIKTIDYILD